MWETYRVEIIIAVLIAALIIAICLLAPYEKEKWIKACTDTGRSMEECIFLHKQNDSRYIYIPLVIPVR